MSDPTGPSLTPVERFAADDGTVRRRRAEMVEGFRAAINRSSGENGSDTPDYILAEYLMRCLEAYDHAVTERAFVALPRQTAQRLEAREDEEIASLRHRLQTLESQRRTRSDGPVQSLDDPRAQAQAAAARARSDAGVFGAEPEGESVSARSPEGFLEWLANGERGISSNTIATFLSGTPCFKNPFGAGSKWTVASEFSPPWDPADLRRCRLLLERVPAFKERFSEMRKVSPEWDRLVGMWDELCATMDVEFRNWREPHASGTCPKTYALMQKALR